MRGSLEGVDEQSKAASPKARKRTSSGSTASKESKGGSPLKVNGDRASRTGASLPPQALQESEGAPDASTRESASQAGYGGLPQEPSSPPSPSLSPKWQIAADSLQKRVSDKSEQQPIKGVQYLLEAMEEAMDRRAERHPASDKDMELWIAAREGRPAGVRAALEAGARVDFELPDTHPLSLVYKNRTVRCQAIHAAAFFHGGGRCPQEGWRQSEEAVRLLLAARAAATATADISADIHKRRVQAIHLAAGMGNAGTIRLLVESQADPDAAASSDGKVHYLPIHDAVWFNRSNSVKCLIEVKATAGAANLAGWSGLHLAAHLGYVDLVGMFLERPDCPELVALKDKAGNTPFDLAVENGQFPPRELSVFTQHLSSEDRARAFIKVALFCPAAAAALLRCGGDSGSGSHGDQVDDEWRESLQAAARSGKITTLDFACLVRNAPVAAMDLLDALTEVPEVQDQQHHPLPVRARLERSHPCPVSCAYEPDNIWQWTRMRQDGAQPWHHDFAPPDAKRGREVRICVLQLQGVLNAEVLSSMAETSEMRFFTKLVVHAMLRFAWRNLGWLFITSFVHEILGSLAFSYWIWWPSSVPGYFLGRLLWCCVASQGLVDGMLILLSGWRCWRLLGRERFWEWLHVVGFRTVVVVCTVALAHNVSEQHWPREGGQDSAMLAANSLLHGVHLLFQLRAFQWSGQRLLPIMKSVQPIAGMMVILLFLVFSFLNAFWAIERGDVDRSVHTFEVVVFLLTGEGFIESDDLRSMLSSQRLISIALTVTASFMFITIMLNVFIAVLSDCYDQEQERMVCTFLKERARICSSLFLLPSWEMLSKPSRLEQKEKAVSNVEPAGQRDARRFQSLGVMALVVLLATGSVLGLQPGIMSSSWPAAIMLSFGLLIAQVHLRHQLTLGWRDRYIWLCHDVLVREEMFLAPDSGDSVETWGRIAVIKRFMYDQRRSICLQSRSEVSGLQQSVDVCFKELAALRSEVRGLARSLREGGVLGPDLSEEDLPKVRPQRPTARLRQRATSAAL